MKVISSFHVCTSTSCFRYHELSPPPHNDILNFKETSLAVTTPQLYSIIISLLLVCSVICFCLFLCCSVAFTVVLFCCCLNMLSNMFRAYLAGGQRSALIKGCSSMVFVPSRCPFPVFTIHCAWYNMEAKKLHQTGPKFLFLVCTACIRDILEFPVMFN